MFILFSKIIYPKLSTNIKEIIGIMRERQIKTGWDENFMLVVDSINKIIYFSTESNLKLLCTYLDGTFTYCAKYFLQLFIFFSEIDLLFTLSKIVSDFEEAILVRKQFGQIYGLLIAELIEHKSGGNTFKFLVNIIYYVQIHIQ